MGTKKTDGAENLLKKAVYLSRSDRARLRKALEFCNSAHIGQFRKSGDPYSSHPIQVAFICAGWQLDAESLIAALLHDTVEDTKTSLKKLSNNFGGTVTELVDGLSKIDELVYMSYEEKAAENFRKMLLATAADVRVILIKLADRLHNMQTLSPLPNEKKKRISKETLEIFAPIAHRLGFNELFRKLEDLCFENLFPKRYHVLNKAMLAATGNRSGLVAELQLKINKYLSKFGIKGKVFGREKTLYSIYLKMKEKKLSFAEVLDLYGFRIIVRNLNDCYIALGAVHSLYKPLPGRFKDYIALPKSNGYQSLHTVVVSAFGTPLELQIRTEKMHNFSEAGIAAHWRYKGHEKEITPLQQKAHEWMQSLLTFQKQTADPSEFLNYLKIDLFPDVVYVFTPQGNIKELPRGSTPIDFAYAIHSDIGNQCTGVKINSELKPLDTILKNGDVVSISQTPHSKPHPNWLTTVRTAKARAAIRHFLKNETKQRAISFGRNLLDNALLGLGSKGVSDDKLAWEQLFNEIGLETHEALYEEIGLGRSLANVTARRLIALSSSRTVREKMSSNAEKTLLFSINHLTESPDVITISGTEGPAVQYASCCYPIAGDPALGNMIGGKGLTIHRKTCSTGHRQSTKDPSKWTDIVWGEVSHKNFISYLELEAIESKGVLAKIAAAISSAGSNIVDLNLQPTQGDHVSKLKIGIEVKNRDHLAEVFRLLRSVSFLNKVHRLVK
ncbi:MAG: hypothetical protein CBC42_00085 [Betaproteobacteria bacterium TMED82]|nr:MAG: hypothetical protein CBC42_00085 [Betaproteobacteria bacterium TMED82]